MERCRQRLEEFLSRMFAPLGRRERQHWGAVYVRGLLLNSERKSVGAMTLRLLEANEQNLQQFLSQSPWALGTGLETSGTRVIPRFSAHCLSPR